MLSRNQIKFIQSLKQKKCRQEHGLFVVEGEKVVQEFLRSDWVVDRIYSTSEWGGGSERISNKELDRISSLKTPNKVLALVRIPVEKKEVSGNLIIALDGVKDPGNLGTIIRLADWFGVKSVLCSEDCVEVFNPKVVQSTMGSLTRVNVHYVDLAEELKGMPNYEVMGAVMSGESIFEVKPKKSRVLVLGSESHGIGENVLNLCNTKITIPKAETSGAESLNVATACAISLAQLRE
jgi:RNA methyltransferase, TrmH family